MLPLTETAKNTVAKIWKNTSRKVPTDLILYRPESNKSNKFAFHGPMREKALKR